MQSRANRTDTYLNQNDVNIPQINAKVVLLGSSGVGKTAMTQRYANNTFVPRHTSTVGASFLTKTVIVDNVKIKLQVWDTAGQERFKSLAPMYYRGASAAMLVYDITDWGSFLKAKEWVEELQTEINQDIVLAVVGNKCDMGTTRAVSREKAISFAKSINALFFETSAKEGEGLDPLFIDVSRRLIDQNRIILRNMPIPGLPANFVDLNVFDERRMSLNDGDTSDDGCCNIL